jgi:hypothetical protein
LIGAAFDIGSPLVAAVIEPSRPERFQEEQALRIDGAESVVYSLLAEARKSKRL